VRFSRELWSFRFSPADGSLLVADGTAVAAFDPATGGELWRVVPQDHFVIAEIDVSPDGRRLALGFLYQYLSDAGHQVWELAGRKPPEPRETGRGLPQGFCRAVAFLPPGERFVVAEGLPSGTIRLDLFTTACRRVHSLDVPFRMIHQLAASADGRLLAALSGRKVLVWALAALESPPVTVSSTTRLALTGVAFHPSGKYLAVTGNDATVKLYDVRTWSLLQTFAWDVGRLRSVAFSPDGCLAAAGSDGGQIVVWDVDV
jgi:WD40 repeat protein